MLTNAQIEAMKRLHVEVALGLEDLDDPKQMLDHFAKPLTVCIATLETTNADLTGPRAAELAILELGLRRVRDQMLQHARHEVLTHQLSTAN